MVEIENRIAEIEAQIASATSSAAEQVAQGANLQILIETHPVDHPSVPRWKEMRDEAQRKQSFFQGEKVKAEVALLDEKARVAALLARVK